VLTGEGVGPEVIAAALDVLDAVGEAAVCNSSCAAAVPSDSPPGSTPVSISLTTSRDSAKASLPTAVRFCAVLAVAVFVYDLRGRFDLYCKLAPIRPVTALRDAGVMRRSRSIASTSWSCAETSAARISVSTLPHRSDQQLREDTIDTATVRDRSHGSFVSLSISRA
jgi:isocitrate/isopropylmalate dehydrogenase